MKKYAYHYHATFQPTFSGSISHVDGIARMDNKIDTMDMHNTLKDIIAGKNDLDRDRIVIESLSFLHRS